MKRYLLRDATGMVSNVVNIRPLADGCMETIEPQQNAVVIQIHSYTGVDGEPCTRKTVHIECKDEEMLMTLIMEAQEIVESVWS